MQAKTYHYGEAQIGDRKVLRLGLLLAMGMALIFAPGQASAHQSSTAADTNSNAAATAPASQQDSLAEAARKAKSQKAQAAASGSKPATVFTNDNLPNSAAISTVGAAPAAATKSPAVPGTAASSSGGQGEKAWRSRFADLHKKLDQDQAELGVMQRELGVLNLQNYDDPVKALQQGYSRTDIQAKTDAIEAKKKDIAADQQAITDGEEELRKAGGDPGWAQ